MEFNNHDSGVKKKIATLLIVLVFASILIAIIIFLFINQDLWRNKPTASNSPVNTQVNESGVPSSSSEPTPTTVVKVPIEIEIKYENDVIIFDGLSKECEYTTVFENNKDFIFEEFRNPEDTKKTSWYQIDNKSTIHFSIKLDEYNLYQLDEDSIFPDDSLIQKIQITKNKKDNTLDIVLITEKCVAITNINITSESASYTLSEVRNKDFYNYSNIYSRKFMFIPDYQLCKQSDSTILFYEDNVPNASDNLYTIRFPAKSSPPQQKKNINFDLEEEKIYINDGYIEYMELKKEEISGVLYYLLSFAFEKQVILYPNSNDYYSTLTFCDPNMENIIFIDAGHGGHDPGTVTRNDDNYNEADINLAICLKIEQILLEQGYNVFMSRNENIYLGFALERGDLANYVNAKLLLSVHVNSYDQESVNGIQTIYRDEQDKDFARVIQSNVLKTALATNRDIVQQYLAIHTRVDCPAATVETGFITNKTESAKLKTDDYQKKLAQGIVNGIIEYLGIMTIVK